ncbi:MAG: DUF6174 domain-containing protein [Gemmatimonadales bacterium]
MRATTSMKSLLVVLAGLVATACSDLGVDVRSLTELERAERKWERFGPESYVYAVERLCFCPTESMGPVRVRVTPGTVLRTYVATGDPVPESYEWLFPTVDGLFDILRQAYADEAHDVEVSYDEDLGYPTDFFIDYEEQVADEELGMRVTEPPVAVPVVLPAGPGR